MKDINIDILYVSVHTLNILTFSNNSQQNTQPLGSIHNCRLDPLVYHWVWPGHINIADNSLAYTISIHIIPASNQAIKSKQYPNAHLPHRKTRLMPPMAMWLFQNEVNGVTLLAVLVPMCCAMLRATTTLLTTVVMYGVCMCVWMCVLNLSRFVVHNTFGCERYYDGSVLANRVRCGVSNVVYCVFIYAYMFTRIWRELLDTITVCQNQRIYCSKFYKVWK